MLLTKSLSQTTYVFKRSWHAARQCTWFSNIYQSIIELIVN